jgi:hypothetical protein
MSGSHSLEATGHATVVLDIGDGVGALVLRTPSSMAGLELDITHHGNDVPFVHSAVRERRLPTGSIFAAVYPELPEGDYTVLDLDGRPYREVHIASGRVTEIDW